MLRQYDVIEATIRLRRGEGWQVKPEAEQHDGRRLKLMVMYRLGPEDSSIYIGEWSCMSIDHPNQIAPLTWIASGDLVDIISAERGNQ